MYNSLVSYLGIQLCSIYKAESNILKLTTVRLLVDESVTARRKEGEKSGRKKRNVITTGGGMIMKFTF